MLLGARMAAWSGGLSAKSYVQDGLVAMWDGIENAGWGTHDATSATWVDLSGNGYNAALESCASFTDDGMLFGGDGIVARCSKALPYNSNANYFEMVANYHGALVDGKVLRLFQGGGYGFSNWPAYVVFHWDGAAGLVGINTGTPGAVYTQPWGSAIPTGTHAVQFDYDFAAYDGEASSSKAWSGKSTGRGYTANAVFGQAYKDGEQPDESNVEIKALRVYSSRLTDAQRAANYAVDKARFGLT